MRSQPAIAVVLSLVVLTLIVMPVTGCSRQPQSSQPVSAEHDVRSSSAKPDPHRAGGQQLAIIVGSRCSEPTRMQFKGDKQGKAFYALDCGRSSFLVAVKADGTGEAITCADADRVKTPCWHPW